ncbi:junctional protein associated with coronary artery disease [Micropterus salmoides]|uniref:junctional protein associated with coronary artery disease n=1 Tax=Micropterus salmoides TaxID=27706 RepID=UPI0018EB3CF2|nr:junctional protein associated with coronary artery disease [Micropterus salmoides]XP_038579848.1 junctional protein associated with coronary artery disease [Micropterus salmoides]
MYSVEDLLISHGYKLPKHTTSSSTPTTVPVSSSCQASSSSPPSYSKHHEILENRPGPRTVNGYERGPGMPYGKGGGTRLPQAYSGGCPNNNNNEHKERSQSRREGESRSQTDTHSLGESLTSDSGFCDGTRGPQSQSKDVSYWRRRGQDFTVLLDYADFREPHGGGQGSYSRPEGSQQARGQELSAEERQRAAQERQRWAAQAQAQVQAQAHAHAQARSREREAALHQWRMGTERKCQSLGTDEWRPAVSFSRQLSQSEGERWAQEQQRLHARTPEGMVVHPRTKAKSQSLPRMLQPESLQYVDIASSGQELYRRVNGHPLSHHDLYRAPRWPENGRPASANQLSMTPKPRFTRPPRPPSYEMHQQIRGSCEMLSGRDSVISQARDRTPLPISRTGDSQMEFFAQDSGPPGYIPPPSYKRAPIMGGGRRGYGEIAVDYRYRGDVYQQIQVAPDGSHWFTRHPAGSWPDPQRERGMSGQKQLYPMYTTHEHPGGGIQYIPFDDPRIRHFSSALGGNSLTDADKIRHIRNELPSVTVSEPASDDSAFLPPPLGPFIAAKLADDSNQTSSSDFDNDNNRWHSDLHKETVDNFPATDQNCNNRYPKNHCPPPSPSSAFQVPLTRTSSHQGSSSDQVFAETITQVKKIVPDSGPENNRNTKRRVSETIFCLVSVPVHTPTNINKDLAADQNNNKTIPSLTVTNTDTFAVGLKERLNVRSKSVNEMPIKHHYSHFHTCSTSSMRNYKRAPLRKEIIDAWALQASEDKEMCYAGSWPGNQYRNQETQTGSPLTVVKSPDAQSPPGGQEPVQSVSDTTTDSGVGTDSSSSYGYPMAGQKNLHLSSNSAFSRLSLSTTQLPSLNTSQDPSSTSKDQDQGDLQPSSPRKSNSSPPESAEQVAFGQFLLKPVNRRPCDAIDELEIINKEMEDTISKRPSMGPCIDDLDGVNKKLEQFKSGEHFTAGPEPGREAISLPPMHIEKPNNIKVRSKSFASTTDLDSMNMRSAFSRPKANNIPPTNDSCLLPSLPQHNESNQLYRQDIPVPQESLLRDVGLTVYTETPGGPGEPMQRSLSVPSPLDHKELSQSVQLSWESRTALVKYSGSPEHNSNKELHAEVETERKAKSDNVLPFRGDVNLSLCRSRSESSRSPQKECSPHATRLSREVSFVFENDDVDERYTISEPLKYKNDSTIADKHLENLLIQEKANSLPAEDLSNLYEVKCAKGIPENESIEQRAARILGIEVPVEALGMADKQSEDNQDDKDTTVAKRLQSQGEETQHVTGECEQVKKEFLIFQGAEEVKETGSGVDHEEGDRQKHRSNHSDGEDNEDTDIQSQVVLDLPEFPPSKLPLSLPVTPDEKLALSMCSVEKRGRGGACKLIESLQDKLNSFASSSATSLGRSSTERMARLKELDSVSRIRHLSLKESGGEVYTEERDGDREESEVQEDKKDVEQQEEEEDKKLEDEGGKEEENPDEHENAHETHDKLGDPEEDCKPKEEVNEVICEDEQRPEEEVEEINDEIALKVENEASKEVGVEIKTEAPGEVNLEIVEDYKENPAENVRDGQNTAEVSRAEATQEGEGEKLPKPKQRTRLQKPPLLPKPRSVPKREITLPLSFSTGTCGPSNTEDEEMLSVSDSYDPSRVERV